MDANNLLVIVVNTGNKYDKKDNKDKRVNQSKKAMRKTFVQAQYSNRKMDEVMNATLKIRDTKKEKNVMEKKK